MHKLKFKFKPGTMPRFAPEYITCIGGCDEIFNDQMEINAQNVRRTAHANDSGYSSIQSASNTQRSNTAVPSNQRNPNTNSITGNSRVVSQVRPNPAAQNVNSRPPTRAAETVGNQNGRSGQTRTNQNPQSQNIRNNPAARPANVGMVASSSNSAWNSSNQNWGNIDSGTAILCNCHDTAMLLTVRKEGPNQGTCLGSFCRSFATLNSLQLR